MSNSILIIVSSLIVLLLIAATFAFFYLKTVRQEINEYWLLLLERLHLRLDKIPNLIETVRKFKADESMKVLIDLRAKIWPVYEADKIQVQSQLEITEKLQKLWHLSKQIPELGKDTNFLALKMEFRQTGSDIENVSEKYNQKIRSYNHKIGFILLAPFAIIFGFKRLPIFEFEG